MIDFIAKGKAFVAKLAWSSLLLLILQTPSYGSESVLSENPAPPSVDKLDGAIAISFKEYIKRARRIADFDKRRQQYPAFIRDTQLHVKPRTYFMDRDVTVDPETQQDEAQAWSAGGNLEYRSGWYRDFFAVGLSHYGSYKVDGDTDEDGTALLKTGQKSYHKFGEAFVKLRWSEQELSFYRQRLDLPYVNSQDSRMTPNSFEAYNLQGSFHQFSGINRFRYILGYIDKIKRRNQDKFIVMTEALGLEGDRDGLYLAGAQVRVHDGFVFGAIHYQLDEIFDITYSEVDYTLPLTEELKTRFQLQYTRQTSDGSDRLTGTDFSTDVYSARAATSYKNAVLSAAFSVTDDDENIRSPFGSYPGYISLMRSDFNRAGEEAWLLGLSYDFSRWELDGISTAINYAKGNGAVNPATGAEVTDRSEFNITLDYRLNDGFLRGLWLRLRWGRLDQKLADDLDEVRVIVNYDLPVL